MNLTQIKAVYTSNLNEKLSHCFVNIEKGMVLNFRKVQQGIDFIIGEKHVNQYSSDFHSDYKDDLIKEIKQKYANDWDVTYIPGDKKKHNRFVFHYKGQPAEAISQTVVQEPVEEPVEEPPKRTSILDLRKE